MFKLFALTIKEIQDTRNIAYHFLTPEQKEKRNKFTDIISSLRFNGTYFDSTSHVMKEVADLVYKLNCDNLTLIQDQIITIDTLLRVKKDKLNFFPFFFNHLMQIQTITYINPSIKQLLYMADLAYIHTIFIDHDIVLYTLELSTVCLKEMIANLKEGVLHMQNIFINGLIDNNELNNNNNKTSNANKNSYFTEYNKTIKNHFNKHFKNLINHIQLNIIHEIKHEHFGSIISITFNLPNQNIEAQNTIETIRKEIEIMRNKNPKVEPNSNTEPSNSPILNIKEIQDIRNINVNSLTEEQREKTNKLREILRTITNNPSVEANENIQPSNSPLTTEEIQDIINVNFNSLTQEQKEKINKFRDIVSSIRFHNKNFYFTSNIMENNMWNLFSQLNFNTLTLIKDKIINLDFFKWIQTNKLKNFELILNFCLNHEIITYNNPTIKQMLYMVDFFFIYNVFIDLENSWYKLELSLITIMEMTEQYKKFMSSVISPLNISTSETQNNQNYNPPVINSNNNNNNNNNDKSNTINNHSYKVQKILIKSEFLKIIRMTKSDPIVLKPNTQPWNL